jgi:hypothetical protein
MIIEKNVVLKHDKRWRTKKSYREILKEQEFNINKEDNISFPDTSPTIIIRDGKDLLIMQFQSKNKLWFRKAFLSKDKAKSIPDSIIALKEKGFIFAENLEIQNEVDPEMPFDHFDIINTKKRVYFLQVMEEERYKTLVKNSSTTNIKQIK